MAEKRTRLIFDLTDADRDALEALRVKLGLRSHAETLRALIRGRPYVLTAGPVEEVSRVWINEAEALPDVRARAPIPPKASLPGVQFGPTPRAAGSGLKPDKVKR